MSSAPPRRGDLPHSRFWLFIPAALICVSAALGMRGAFAAADIVPPSAAAAVLATAIVALAAWRAAPGPGGPRGSDRFVPFALAGGVLGWIVLVPLGSIWYAAGHGGGTTSYADVVTVLRSAVTDGARQILTTTPPAPPTAVALAAAGTCVWWAALWTAVSAARGTSPLAALLPATVLLGLGSAASAGAGNPGTVSTAAAFLVAALFFLGVDRATREQPADMIVSGPRGSRRGSIAGIAPFFVGVTVLALGACALGPHLPGLAQRAPWDPRTLVAPPVKPQDETDPLTQAVAWLKRGDPAPLFTIATNAPQQRLRWQILDVYDGRHWSSSASYRPAGKALPTGNAVDAPPGPSISVHESVKLSGLPGPYLPAPGRVRSVSGTSVRDDPRLGMIATGDGHDAGPLGYSADSTVPVFDDVDRLQSATPGSGGPLDAFRALPGTPPAAVTAFAAKAADGASPYDQMASLASAVHEAFKFDPASAAGQSYGRLSTLVTYGKDQDHPSAASADAFATLFAVAARASGMPSRLVVGFVPKPASGAGADGYQVAGPDVRVWPEVYFTGVGWVPFYAAVPDGDASGSGEDSVHVQPTGAPSTPDPATPSQATPGYSGPSVRISDSRSGHGGSSMLPLIVAASVAGAVLLVLGYAGIGAFVRRRRRSARRGDPDPRRRTQWAWQDGLDALGYPPHSTVTPHEIAVRAPTPLGEQGAEPIRRLAGLAELAAYAAQPPRPEQADEAWGCAEQIRVLVRRRTPRRVRMVRALRPRAGRPRRH